jgi:hypothetical protein
MNLTALIDRLDDRLNPIVVKELRQAVKSRMVVGILLLFLGLQLFLLGFYLLMREVRGQASTVDWSAGNEVFRVQQGILLWTIMILVPAYAAIRLASERSEQNVDLMFISTLRPASIVWGKFFAAFVLGLLIFSACAPFMTFCYLLRGIDIPTILFVLGIDLLAMTFGVMVALFLSSLPGARAAKFFFCFIGFILLCWACALLTAMTVALVWEGGFIEWMFEHWYIAAVTVAAVLGVSGLLFFYCVAMISPPSANRILPLRVYLFLAWLIVGVSLFLVATYHKGGVTPIPLYFMLLIVCPLLAIQLWVSICERERWAPRVARTIPRRRLLRVPAFLFYTGSAGGIAFTVLLYAATIGGIALWLEDHYTAGGVWDAGRNMIRAHALIALYAYCYGLSAVLVRHYLLANQLKPSYTWLVALLLGGLGSSVPAVIAFILFQDQMNYNRGDPGWWSLPNPFVAVWDTALGDGRARYDDYEQLCFWFTGTWAVLVTALSLPWFVAQAKRFHPPPKREAEPLKVVLVEEKEKPAAVEPVSDAIVASLPERG